MFKVGGRWLSVASPVLRKHPLLISQFPESSLLHQTFTVPFLPVITQWHTQMTSLYLVYASWLWVTVEMLLWGMSLWDQSATGGVIVQLLPCYCLKGIVFHVPSLQVTGETGSAEVMEDGTHLIVNDLCWFHMAQHWRGTLAGSLRCDHLGARHLPK